MREKGEITPSRAMRLTGRLLVVVTLLVSVVLLVGCGDKVASAKAALQKDRLLEGSAAEHWTEGCVEPTAVMRRDHMEFILHQRDETVHKGIRTSKHSLKNCIDCHVRRTASGEAIAINAPGQFCESCHSAVAAKLDCFECHATIPAKGPEVFRPKAAQATTASPEASTTPP